MLNIYYGSETADKEKYIFENIDPEKKTIIIVPDQFSLQMEKNALEFFRPKALFNLMVTDFSALGNKVVHQAGGKTPELIDRYGRHMLLSVIIDRLSDELDIYKNMKGKSSFVEMTNSLISQMKRYGIEPKALTDEGGEFLRRKLSDIRKLYTAYEEAIKGKFLDTEDYVRFYGELMAESELTRGADIWIYGFDTFTPINMSVMGKLLSSASRLNVVMTWEKKPAYEAGLLTTGGGEGLFDLTAHVMRALEGIAEENGSKCHVAEIPSKDIAVKLPEHITLAETSNIYTEAERAAMYITDLVRDEGYKYGDIAVICNDMQVRGRVLMQTLSRWGIPVFVDIKRTVLHQPVVRFVLSFLEIIAKGYSTDSVMEMVKSGLLGWNTEDEEMLQNYAFKYKIRGASWKKPFTLGQEEYGESLNRLNEMRDFICQVTEQAKEEIGRRNKADEKLQGLYLFLDRDFDIRNKIEELINRQEDLGLTESAAETAQSWNLLCSILEQADRIIGSERISNEVLKNIIETGLKEAEIGLVPLSGDCVIIGTMQRTRLGRNRVLMVTGACEGIIPMEPESAGLLTKREMESVDSLCDSIAQREEVMRGEEQLAIYRMFSLPEDKLYVSYAMTDEAAQTTSPSAVFNALKEIKISRGEEINLLKDPDIRNFPDAISSLKGTLPYLSEAVRELGETGRMDYAWRQVLKWYEKNDGESLSRVNRGIIFSNRLEWLERELTDALYMGGEGILKVSASRLEKFSGCPFAHFIDYGLKAQEQRIFEVDARGIGTVYHNCLMTFSQLLTDNSKDCSSIKCSADEMDLDGKLTWNNINEKQCAQMTAAILHDQMAAERESAFEAGPEGSFRMKRIEEICSSVAWALVQQVRKGRIKEMRFEQPFGYEGGLPPIEVSLSDGKRAMLRGVIDRMDILKVDDEEAVRIIDYKTGSPQINVDYFRSGYKLQLMVYMNAAGQQELKPAGVFHFLIDDYEADADIKGTPKERGETLEERIREAYKLEGIMVSDERIFEAMDETATEGWSDVIPLKYVKSKGEYKESSGGVLLSEEEFHELRRETAQQVERICREIYDGNINIAPKREAKSDRTGAFRTSCTYCRFRSVCMFDTSFEGCNYTKV